MGRGAGGQGGAGGGAGPLPPELLETQAVRECQEALQARGGGGPVIVARVIIVS